MSGIGGIDAKRLGDAARDYLRRDPARFHMPGHKGKTGDGLELLGQLPRIDLTELPGLDSLYHADGPIRATERAWSGLCGSADSVLSAGGATLCIQAMLALALRPGERLLCARGVHTAAVNAMALLDLRPVWLMPEGDPESGLPRPIAPEAVGAALEAHPDIRAVYLTSPDYFGAIPDLVAIAARCRAAGVPLLVDGAHGAHLPFVDGIAHPIEAGADLCCDSLHKTLPVLTGGALLHVGNPVYAERARRALALFGSTSPGYPVMLSADLALDWLRENPDAVSRCCARLEDIRRRAAARGLLLPATAADPMRLVLGGAPLGLNGEALGGHLRAHGVEPELAAGRFCVLMASPFNDERDYERLEAALEALPRTGIPLPPAPPPPARAPAQRMTPRAAVFADCETLPLADCLGRTAGMFAAPCPPGIAIVIPGEQIDGEELEALKNSGISRLDVVK